MAHYVCTGGCGGVSETPGTCQTEGCPKHEHPLAECNCGDGQHAEVMAKAVEETAEQPPKEE